MKRLVFLILFTVLQILGYYCDRSPFDPPPNGVPGTYSYTGYDSTDTAVVKGWFTLVKKDSAHLAGEWHFGQIVKSHPVGPQIGDGELVGGEEDKMIWLNLNPNMKDNNVFLQGELVDGVYKGNWIWVTIVGPTTGGRFAAVKN